MPRAHLALLVLAVAAFSLLAVGYEHDPFATIDREVADRGADALPVVLELAARPFSWIGGPVGLTVLGVIAVMYLVRERAWLDVAFLLTTFVGSQIVVSLIKDVFDRPRPDVGSAVELPSSSAFPSGHATAGVASMGALVVLLAERLPSRRARVWLWSSAVVLGIAIGLSRIVLNVHFVTDVLAGWCLGLAWLAACLLARERLREAG